MMKNQEQIVHLLKTKASTKQEVYSITKQVFADFQERLKQKENEINKEIENEQVQVSYSSEGNFESKLKFSGDTLLFHMHSNVFDFPSSHPMHKTKYIKEDKLRSFCGVINIYNFLSDSFKFNRMNDAGYLIARVFINKDKHFFLEGDKQLGFLFNDFVNQQINTKEIEKIIEETMVYALNFDLQTPNFNEVKVVSVHQILDINNNQKLKTAKRMGYKFSFETNND
ncbi:MAG: hypothetical protein HON40_03915 [Flavobacteriales bacterium]|jgi:hypothetical protein|nr:hypothetical protein [Flavobacteriales bacterium]MDG1348451.1 hypothetical protein [Flavobacteriales bacterium]|tara:strand:- start:1322 stop:1999 length:678 start_codon:yes stop_codon:yes gene_type:complete